MRHILLLAALLLAAACGTEEHIVATDLGAAGSVGLAAEALTGTTGAKQNARNYVGSCTSSATVWTEYSTAYVRTCGGTPSRQLTHFSTPGGGYYKYEVWVWNSGVNAFVRQYGINCPSVVGSYCTRFEL